MNEDQEVLHGGQSTESVIRIGDTVHRSMGPHSEYVHKLLKLLEVKAYSYAPRYLGIDEADREILTFTKGEVAKDIVWTDEMLAKVVLMIKEFHDATAGSELCNGEEVVCHRDLAPWNTIMINNNPVGFIDFDDAGPGPRVKDLAYFLWTFLDLGSNTQTEVQTKRIKYLCDIYGYTNGPELVNSILHEQRILLAFREDLAKNSDKSDLREFSKNRAEEIKQQIKWVEENRESIEKEFIS